MSRRARKVLAIVLALAALACPVVAAMIAVTLDLPPAFVLRSTLLGCPLAIAAPFAWPLDRGPT